MKEQVVEDGIYRHFKGNLYHVFAVGLNTDNEERMVIYRRIERIRPGEWGASDQFWIRREEEFLESVAREGKTFPRFEFCDKVPE